MAAITCRRGKWIVDYRDQHGIRRGLAVEGGRAEAEAELKRLGDAGELWVRKKRRTNREVERDRQLEEASRTKPTAWRQHQQHGLNTLRNAVNELAKRGQSPIDEATETGQALVQWRNELVQDLGGEEALSTQQRYIVDLVTRLRLMLDSIDAWLLDQPTLVNKQRRQLYPAVRERTGLADSMVRNLELLGLKRQSRQVGLADYLKRGGESTPPEGSS
jgi:hypothetical protein